MTNFKTMLKEGGPLSIQDKHNPEKKWLLKRSPCRHYYWTQEISGYQMYPFRRTTLEQIEKTLG